MFTCDNNVNVEEEMLIDELILHTCIAESNLSLYSYTIANNRALFTVVCQDSLQEV